MSGWRSRPRLEAARAAAPDRRAASQDSCVDRAGRGARVRASDRESLRVVLLVAPLFLLLLLSFCLPIAALLTRAVYDPTMPTRCRAPRPRSPRSPGRGAPDEPPSRRSPTTCWRRKPEIRSTTLPRPEQSAAGRAQPRTARRARAAGRADRRGRDDRGRAFWGDDATWFAIRNGVHPFTAAICSGGRSAMVALRRRRAVPADQAIFRPYSPAPS